MVTDFSTSRKHSTTCCIVASLHISVCCCFALLRFITTWRHEIYCGVLFSLKSLVQSSKKKKSHRKKKSLQSFIDQNALSDNLWKILQNVRIQKWPAMRRELDRSSPRSGRTLSVDRPLLFWALHHNESLWIQQFTQFTQLLLLCNFGKIDFLRRGCHYTHIALSWMHRWPKLTLRGKGVM